MYPKTTQFYLELTLSNPINPKLNQFYSELSWDLPQAHQISSLGDKVECVFTMVYVSILPQAEYGPNDYWEDASLFTISPNPIHLNLELTRTLL